MKWKSNLYLCVVAFFVFGVQTEADTIFTATLSGASDSAITSGSGNATVDFNSSMTQISYTLSFQNLTSDATMGHIHFGAPGVAGPIVLWFFPATLTPTPTAVSGSYSGVWTEADLAAQTQDPSITTFATLLSDMQAGDTYVNVHTLNYPGGEIRGQLGMVPEPRTVKLLGVSFLLFGAAALRRKYRASC
jgi:hypothetical protein